MKTLKNLKNIKGKKVLLRVDFNVPILNGKVLDDFRIRKVLPTIQFLIDSGAEKIILITHLGKDGSDSLDPVIQHFFKITKFSKEKITFFDNIRKFDGEIKNDVNFAKKLARLVDPLLSGKEGIYINDAFSVSHRMHASIVTLPKYLPSYAGFQLEEEIKNLSKVNKNTKHPFLFILGGAKFSTKIPLILKYLKLADYVFIGGALSNDFLKASGYEVGKSLIEIIKYDFKKILKNKKLILPKDVTVLSGNKLINKKIEQIKKDEIILDIGKESIKELCYLIEKSKLILWNGPLGKYEDGGDVATKNTVKAILKSSAQTIIGGGDIVSLVHSLDSKKQNVFISTGGGATLEFLTNKTLPGIKALQ